MKIIPPYQITSEILNLINEATEYLILISPFVDFKNWDTIKTYLCNAQKRNVKITFYVRLDNENSKSWEQVEELGIKPRLIKNLHTKLYFNEKTGIVTSMNLLLSSSINAIEFGSIYNTNAELNELKEYVKKYLQPNIVEEKPSDEDLYFDKEKFTIILQNTLSNVFNRQTSCRWRNGVIEFDVFNSYYVEIDKVKNELQVSGRISQLEYDNFQTLAANEHRPKNTVLKLSDSCITLVRTNRLTSSKFDFLNVNEKKEIIELIVNFVNELGNYKDYCYKTSKASS